MILSDISVRRPVLATVVSLIIVLIGIVSYQRLSVREYPKIDEPVVTVETKYRGASAEVIESRVTKPLEDALAGIEGVDVLTSISRAENSQITVKFRLERNPDAAASDVRDRVARTRGKLPVDIEEPVIAKVEADANPIIWLAFSSDRLSPLEVTDIAEPPRQAAAADAAGRGRRARLRRAPLLDADLARPQQARRLPADAAGCRGCAPPRRTSRCRRVGSRAARASSRSSPRPISRGRCSSRT